MKKYPVMDSSKKKKKMRKKIKNNNKHNCKIKNKKVTKINKNQK